MAEPNHVVECPYCHAISLTRDSDRTILCHACNQVMMLVRPGEEGYGEAERDYAMLTRIKERDNR